MKKPDESHRELPKQIFVYWDGYDGGREPEPVLRVKEDLHGIEHGKPVGVYQLDEIKIKKVTEELI